jgi:hypothetical protein
MLVSVTSADRLEPGRGDQLYWLESLLRCKSVGRSGRRYFGTGVYQKRSQLAQVWLSSLILYLPTLNLWVMFPLIKYQQI